MRDAAMEQILRRLALEAGAAIMEVYGRADLGETVKADQSPLTAADLAADAIICAGLAAAYPEIAVVTEERADTHAQRDPVAPYFLVDPLDGTREFAGRRSDFTINIALIEAGRSTAGIVYAPATRRLFRTAAGGGALEETGALDPLREGSTRRVAVTTADMAALRVVASRSHRDAATEAYIARYSVGSFTPVGSSLKFCLVAAGEADLYPRLGRTMEWDTAAGQAVLEAAGGRVRRLDGGGPLLYGKLLRENPHFVAAGAGVKLFFEDEVHE